MKVLGANIKRPRWRRYEAWPRTPFKAAATVSIAVLALVPLLALVSWVQEGPWGGFFVAWYGTEFALWIAGLAWLIALATWSVLRACRIFRPLSRS